MDYRSRICPDVLSNLKKKKIPCHAVCNNMALDPMPDKLKDFFKKRKSIDFKNNFV